jgi:hypothetical protein
MSIETPQTATHNGHQRFQLASGKHGRHAEAGAALCSIAAKASANGFSEYITGFVAKPRKQQ